MLKSQLTEAKEAVGKQFEKQKEALEKEAGASEQHRKELDSKVQRLEELEMQKATWEEAQTKTEEKLQAAANLLQDLTAANETQKAALEKETKTSEQFRESRDEARVELASAQKALSEVGAKVKEIETLTAANEKLQAAVAGLTMLSVMHYY